MTFQMDTLEKSCGCLHVKPPPKTAVVPNDAIEIELSVDVPAASTKAEVAEVVTLKNSQGISITVPIKYRIAGLVSFLGSGFNSGIATGAKHHEFRVPFFYTSPVDPQNISIKTSDSLSKLKTQIAREGDQWYVRCRLDSETSFTETLTGELELSESEFGSSSTTRCIIEVKKPLVVSPFVLRFSHKHDAETSPASEMEFTATAIAAIDKALFSIGDGTEKPRKAKEPTPSFHFTTPSKTFGVKTKRLSKGIYRLYLSVNFGEEDGELLATLKKDGLAELFYTAKLERQVIRGKVKAVFK
jgi:hypothetical protein